MAALEDEQPCLRLTWSRPQTISRVELTFDTDYDHPMESVLMGHPERVMPFCVPNLVVLNGRVVHDAEPAPPSPASVKVVGASGFATEYLRKSGHPHDAGSASQAPHPKGLLARVTDNHQTRRTLHFDEPVTTDRLEIHLTAPSETVPAALFEVRCYR